VRGRCVVERGANSIWPYCSVGGIVNIEVPFLCHIQQRIEMRRYRSPSPSCSPHYSRPSSPPSSARLSRSISPISQSGRSLSRSCSPRGFTLSRSPTSFSAISHDHLARKRPRQDSGNSLGVPSLLSPWGWDPNYGIVHLSGCSICRSYMTHMAEASYSPNQPSFQLALKDRDNKHDAYFFDGVREGRRRQRLDDERLLDDLERYRAERNEALDTVGRYRIECKDAHDELSSVKDRFRASQTECERLRQRVEVFSGEKLDQANQAMKLEALEVERVLLNSETSPKDIALESASTLQGPASANTPVQSPGAVGVPSVEPLTAPVTNVPSSEDLQRSASATSLLPNTYAAAASSQLVVARQKATSAHSNNIQSSVPPTLSIAGYPTSNLSARPAAPTPGSATADLRTTSAQANIPSTLGRNPKNIRQLQSLMNAAHKPGNDGALAKVKALCAEAHQTPRDQKTDLQRFLLSNWRNPGPAGEHYSHPLVTPPLPNQQPPITNPRMEDPVDVWYAYLSTHPGSWPRGVRRDSRGRPNLPDLKASRTVARLRPEVDVTGNMASRSEFMSYVARLFAEPGMYEQQLERNMFRVAPIISYKSYHGPPTITLEEVIRHFADCGITVAEATQELEPWAREYQATAASMPTQATSSGVQQRHGGVGRFTGHPIVFRSTSNLQE